MFLRELENPINVPEPEVLNALMDSVNALEKLLAISELKSLRSVLGKSVQAKLAPMSTLGMSVKEILTQVMTSTLNISSTELLEAQIAALKHGELHSLLGYFTEKLQIIIDIDIDLIESKIREQELILNNLTKN